MYRTGRDFVHLNVWKKNATGERLEVKGDGDESSENERRAE